MPMIPTQHAKKNDISIFYKNNLGQSVQRITNVKKWNRCMKETQMYKKMSDTYKNVFQSIGNCNPSKEIRSKTIFPGKHTKYGRYLNRKHDYIN